MIIDKDYVARYIIHQILVLFYLYIRSKLSYHHILEVIIIKR